MSIQDRNLKPGTTLVARYKKEEHRCTVVEGEGGKVRYRLKDGREFSSPSAAGSAVMDGVACNGWRFWTPEGEAKAAAPAGKATSRATGAKKAASKSEAKPKAAKPKAAKKGATKRTMKPAKAAKIGCGECPAEFESSREAAEHLRTEHGAPEAQGMGGF